MKKTIISGLQKNKHSSVAALGFLLFLSAFLFSTSFAQAAAGINKQINFQGKVVNTDGTNVANASYNFVFSIYSQQAPGGSVIWTESKSLTVTDGIFQTNLGDTTTLPGSVDFNSDNIYLGINFNSNGEMTPRVQFTASPYAFNTLKLNGNDWAAPAAIGTTTAAAGTFTNLSTTTGGLTIAAGQTYGGAGALTIASASATGLTINSGTTGAINIGDDASNETISIGTGNAIKTLVIGSLNTSSGITIQSGSSGIKLQANGTSTGEVQIGTGGAGSTTPDLLALDVKSDAGDPAGAAGKMYYNSSTGKFRCYQAAAWTDCIGAGGAASAAGTNTQVQFNNAGAFGADSGFTFDPATQSLSLNGPDAELILNGITNEPAAPTSGNLKIYSKSVAGRMVPKVIGPAGIDTPLQNAFWQNNITMWNPTTATAGVWLGTAGAGAGTYSTALPTSTSLYTSMKRGRWANVVTTTNQVLGQRNTEAMYFRGSVANQGGFFFYARMGFDVWTNGSRFFGGMHSATTVISADPSALNNTMGFAVDAADNGAISFLTRGTVATKASTGFTITSGKGYDIYIFAKPNDTHVYWRIVDINTGAEANGDATATLPTNTTMLTTGVLASNGALTTATATQLGLNRIYVETDK